jgi:EmrB/QacA subfamily drug resistance transporter
MSIAQATVNENSDRLDLRAWGTLLVLCGALFMDALDVSMIGVALPSIQADLGLSTSTLQWVVSGYVLGYGGFLLLGGRAADLFGRKRMFLISLAVFLVASGLGAVANDGTMLIATRFIKGVSAAFTAPAGLSIITTSFAEGPARNRALSIYTSAGATGFSLGLVFSGVLTEASWRWVLLLPVPMALIVLLGAIRLVPDAGRPANGPRSYDLLGAFSLTSAMLLLVFTVVEAPDAGWASARTLGSFAGVAALLAAFVALELRSTAPLVRLGILRSASLVRANLAMLTLFAGWVGFQFIAVLYMQQLRGWSAIETGLAIFPGGLMVALLAPTVIPRLVGRYSVQPVILTGMVAAAIAYPLFLGIGANSNYITAMLPTFVLAGLAFAFAYGPLNIAATNGIEPHEQGLAGGLVNTSFQFGGALGLAVATAVNNANGGPDGSPQAVLDGFQAALIVPVFAAAIGVVVVASGLIKIPLPAVRLPVPAIRPLAPPALAPVPIQRDALLAPANGDRLRVGIIGAGRVGSTAAALLASAGHEVALSNSRGPESLLADIQRIGPNARAVTPAEAAAFGDIVLVAIPFGRYQELPVEELAGRVVVDATNYFPERDGQINGLGNGRTSSELIAELVPGASVVKAFNTLNYARLRDDARPSGTPGRLALPHAGDDPSAKAVVSRLIDAIGFDPVDTGSLSDGGRRQEPGAPLFNRPLTVEEWRDGDPEAAPSLGYA